MGSRSYRYRHLCCELEHGAHIATKLFHLMPVNFQLLIANSNATIVCACAWVQFNIQLKLRNKLEKLTQKIDSQSMRIELKIAKQSLYLLHIPCLPGRRFGFSLLHQNTAEYSLRCVHEFTAFVAYFMDSFHTLLHILLYAFFIYVFNQWVIFGTMYVRVRILFSPTYRRIFFYFLSLFICLSFMFFLLQWSRGV